MGSFSGLVVGSSWTRGGLVVGSLEYVLGSLELMMDSFELVNARGEHGEVPPGLSRAISDDLHRAPTGL
eukprot:CAMPEP_0183334072 /NCGR_PEP_ID=MMETSP0164_2-20130417/2784_1 /TAXON_ID=221442 /ORGANISM="Coccolithus pelagicus ssp braarudi, Strain PLY182g" /LENGTH=68 /DNA_ID=CAMNT_0025503141 /DNA_START=106 /DNA_END=312 /DNA_ORIENTATION=+